MSKISEENWLWGAIRIFWKRSAALATVYADRYRYDPFLRTQVQVIGVLVLFSLFLIFFASFLVEYLFTIIAMRVIDGIRESILVSSSTPIADTMPVLDSLRLKNTAAVALITAATAIFFGYLVTRVALGPTRTALTSQKQFIGNVAHELRTPLAVIKTNTEVALLSQVVSEETRAIMHSTVEELDRLSLIINNLLSLSSSVRPERIEFSAVDVALITKDVMGKLQNLSRARALDITFRKSDSCYVWGNAAALEQIIMNVVKNAINYTGRGGHVAVTVEQIGESHVEIIVQDSGTGIARQDLFHIFEPFYRAEYSRNRASGGSGLGLAIVSELVKLHHGKITVRSAVGRGTTVVIALPATPHPESDRTIRERKTLDEVAVDYSHNKL